MVCRDDQMLSVLEAKWGNDAFCIYYRLWKQLGSADFHYIDLRPFGSWELFLTQMKVSESVTVEILDKLARMGVIDKELWGYKVLWSDSFVESVKDVWIKRKVNVPRRPIFLIRKQNENKSSAKPLAESVNDHVSGSDIPEKSPAGESLRKPEETPQEFTLEGNSDRDEVGSEPNSAGSFVISLGKVMGRIREKYPDQSDYNNIVLFVQNNKNGANENTLLRCLEQLSELKTVDDPGAYLESIFSTIKKIGTADANPKFNGEQKPIAPAPLPELKKGECPTCGKTIVDILITGKQCFYCMPGPIIKCPGCHRTVGKGLVDVARGQCVHC